MIATNDSNDLEALFDSIAADFSPAPVAASAPAAAPTPAPVPAPPKPAINQLGDSDDLQALFDSVSAEVAPPPPPPQPIPSPAQSVAAVTKKEINQLGDSDDLQALFDSVSNESQVQSAPAEPVSGAAPEDCADAWPRQEAVFNRIGNMARVLHDTLTELGYEKLLEQTVSALPDAKDRLAYVANLTEQAACRVLNATDIANPLVEQIELSSKKLGERWDKVFANQLSPGDFKKLAEETRAFLNRDLPQKTSATHAQLTEIMMAQDFQDLTGQVIKKIVNLAQTLEAGLMGVLVEVVPETKRTQEVTSLMNGPVVNAEGRTDVVVNQEQVDDLLDSLGF